MHVVVNNCCLLLLLLLVGCGSTSNGQDKTNPSLDVHYLSTQTDAVDKAREAEQNLLDAARQQA